MASTPEQALTQLADAFRRLGFAVEVSEGAVAVKAEPEDPVHPLKLTLEPGRGSLTGKLFACMYDGRGFDMIAEVPEEE